MKNIKKYVEIRLKSHNETKIHVMLNKNNEVAKNNSRQILMPKITKKVTEG